MQASLPHKAAEPSCKMVSWTSLDIEAETTAVYKFQFTPPHASSTIWHVQCCHCWQSLHCKLSWQGRTGSVQKIQGSITYVIEWSRFDYCVLVPSEKCEIIYQNFVLVLLVTYSRISNGSKW